MILLRHHNTSISASENLIVSFSTYTQRIHNAGFGEPLALMSQNTVIGIGASSRGRVPDTS